MCIVFLSFLLILSTLSIPSYFLSTLWPLFLYYYHYHTYINKQICKENLLSIHGSNIYTCLELTNSY